VYIYIAAAAYFVTLFLTLRDIRIYRRTGFSSYRKGALKGIIALTVIMVGVLIVSINPDIGLVLVLIGLFINRKGVREKIFTDAPVLAWIRGKTDIVNDPLSRKKA
jgi:hypothetical protein